MPLRKCTAPQSTLEAGVKPVAGGLAPRRVCFTRAGVHSLSQEAYDRLAEKFLERYRSAPVHTSTALWAALESARADLAAGGLVSGPQALRFHMGLARDLAQMASLAASGTGAVFLRSTSRDAGALSSLAGVLAISEQVSARIASASSGIAIRRAGEVTCAGTLSCVECGRTERIRASAVVEPCRDCGAKTLMKTL